MTPPSPQSSGFETELARRTLISEQRRAAILAWTLTGLFLLTAVFALVAQLRGEPLPGYGWILLIACLGCGFEWLTSRYLGTPSGKVCSRRDSASISTRSSNSACRPP